MHQPRSQRIVPQIRYMLHDQVSFRVSLRRRRQSSMGWPSQCVPSAAQRLSLLARSQAERAVVKCLPLATGHPSPQNDPHQRMAGEDFRCQHANYRHSAAWDCSHLRFIAICDSAAQSFPVAAHCRNQGSKEPVCETVYCSGLGKASGWASALRVSA